MAVRNFWQESFIDGRETTLAGGPRAKDGGMITRWNTLCGGKTETILIVRGKVTEDGKLRTEVRMHGFTWDAENNCWFREENA